MLLESGNLREVKQIFTIFQYEKSILNASQSVVEYLVHHEGQHE